MKALAGALLANAVPSQGWGEFASMLGYQAAGAGGQVVEVHLHRTAQLCPGGGALVPRARGWLASGLDGAVRRQRGAPPPCVA